MTPDGGVCAENFSTAGVTGIFNSDGWKLQHAAEPGRAGDLLVVARNLDEHENDADDYDDDNFRIARCGCEMLQAWTGERMTAVEVLNGKVKSERRGIRA